jgi:hypothetical protein
MSEPKKKLSKPTVKYRTDLSKGDPLPQPLRDKQITFSSQAAFAHLELAVFDGERPVSDQHVQMLLDEARQGRFNWQLVTLVTAELAGTVYRLNGQHTAWMRINLPPNSSDPSVRLLHYSCKDEVELRALYSIIDRNKSRNGAHILRVMAGGDTAFEGVWSAALSLYGAAWKLWKSDGKDTREVRGRYGPSETFTAFQENTSLLLPVATFVQSNYIKLIRRRGVVGAMFATWEKAPSVAEEFWKPVTTGLGLDSETDPRWRLRNLLIDLNAIGYDHEILYRCCISAWNKRRAGEKALTTIRPTEERKKPR